MPKRECKRERERDRAKERERGKSSGESKSLVVLNGQELLKVQLTNLVSIEWGFSIFYIFAVLLSIFTKLTFFVGGI